MWETLNQRIWISDNIKDKRILNQLANENESQSQRQPICEQKCLGKIQKMLNPF